MFIDAAPPLTSLEPFRLFPAHVAAPGSVPASDMIHGQCRSQLEAFRKDLGKLFATALLITGCVPLAEEALESSIGLPDAASQRATHRATHRTTHRQAVMDIVVRASLAVTACAGILQEATDAEAALPAPELRRVLGLDAALRRCFVLRRLCGFSGVKTALLLGLQLHEVDSRTNDASLRLAEPVLEAPVPSFQI